MRPRLHLHNPSSWNNAPNYNSIEIASGRLLLISLQGNVFNNKLPIPTPKSFLTLCAIKHLFFNQLSAYETRLIRGLRRYIVDRFAVLFDQRTRARNERKDRRTKFISDMSAEFNHGTKRNSLLYGKPDGRWRF